MNEWKLDNNGGKSTQYKDSMRELANFFNANGKVDKRTVATFDRQFEANNTYTQEMHAKKKRTRIAVFIIVVFIILLLIFVGYILSPDRSIDQGESDGVSGQGYNVANCFAQVDKPINNEVDYKLKCAEDIVSGTMKQ